MPLKKPATNAPASEAQHEAGIVMSIEKRQVPVKRTYDTISPFRYPANLPGAQATVISPGTAANPLVEAQPAVKPEGPAENKDAVTKNKIAAGKEVMDRPETRQTASKATPPLPQKDAPAAASANTPATLATPASHYLENEVLTASPEKLTLMLYDGAIRFMNQAVIHIAGKNFAASNNASQRAQDIFTELMSTLNMDYPIAKDLFSLYDFIKNSLLQANIKKDSSLVRELIAMTRDLRNTWAQAMQTVRR